MAYLHMNLGSKHRLIMSTGHSSLVIEVRLELVNIGNGKNLKIRLELKLF